MQDSQKKIIYALLTHIYGLGLISEYTYSAAGDLVHSMIDLPEFFRYPVGLPEGDTADECT